MDLNKFEMGLKLILGRVVDQVIVDTHSKAELNMKTWNSNSFIFSLEIGFIDFQKSYSQTQIMFRCTSILIMFLTHDHPSYSSRLALTDWDLRNSRWNINYGLLTIHMFLWSASNY